MVFVSLKVWTHLEQLARGEQQTRLYVFLLSVLAVL